MASNFKDCSKNPATNEQLYDHFYFQILQAKKDKLKSYDLIYGDAMREFIRHSDFHCHQQNMTTAGSENYKAELYSDYFKLIDSKEEKGLLPVVSCDKKQPPLTSVEKQNFLSMQIKPFITFLPDFKTISVNDTKSEALNLIVKPSPFNSFKPAPENRNKNQTKSGFLNRHLMPTNTIQKRPLQKIVFDEVPENPMHSNKKLCPPPKKSNPEVGFVSASSMYRNPLKKASNASVSNPYKTNSDSRDSVEDEHSELKNHDTLKHFDKKIVDIVLNEIMDFSPDIRWNDIAGLEFVKTTVQEIVIWPLLRPDIFTGLRAPPRGILLFGPPGTGKTLIGKCIATESNSTFFCISASSLASKWVGESEQMVRALFAAARLNQPAVIFIDEIDSLLSQRSDKDQDFSRKLKTEFLVQFDGAKTNTEERVLVVGATNRPHELDEAARRRFVKRLYVPLPDESARRQIIKKLIEAHQHGLSDEDLQKICDETKGYSGSDVAHLCKEAAMGPIRCIGPENIKTVSLDQVRPIALCDFTDALRQVRASVVADDLNYYLEWNKKFGSFGIPS